MTIIVDANIVFSAVLNMGGQIADLLVNSAKLTFIAPDFLRAELHSHYDKLIKLSRLSLHAVQEAEFRVCNAITFMSEDIISFKIWQGAANLVSDVDEKDIAYIAFAKHFNALLWTGDKHLIRGLLRKDFHDVITTNGLLALREDLE